MPEFVRPNSYSEPPEGVSVSTIMEKWSDAARAAAAASRKQRGKGIPARKAAARAGYRKAGGTEGVGSGRMKAPNTSQVRLNSNERPVDYGHVNDLMKEKYGKGRGNRAYHNMIDHPGSMRGLHFVVGTKIQKEKRAMMDRLGMRGKLDDHKYRSLYSQWLKAGGK